MLCLQETLGCFPLLLPFGHSKITVAMLSINLYLQLRPDSLAGSVTCAETRVSLFVNEAALFLFSLSCYFS